ncbi:bifunctional fucokinase/L-fucose-1-P-guanylyltransferase [Parabacteroides distasonis]|uniref:Bifunctional fucokinase/L-fucose-1-P-guanylyltransferase n=2 Tax=Parabacteroides distasonis TaxID=823 RepID=A0A3L7ZRC0_PARDI|nr:bifunctional fucokinase/L-fucose-1-P-guanylyltransferase [Parabacteroides distasonis]RLT72853.1 bifunctional fucokinase/L-fucose-1-P-guanylyltransferase [Parabacteroides distasonis]
MIMGMKKLLSLPPNLVDSFHAIEHVSAEEWFCASDPVGARLGSGGGTTWLLEASRRNEAPGVSMEEWLGQEKRILLHAGGQSRRLPGYAPSGKILTPIPVFRWARGQRLSQNLLSLQLPLYERIMQKAPESLHTLIASGDVYIRANQPLQEIPEVDVVCYGLWVEPSLAKNHGVFVSSRKSPDILDFMLQKPSLETLGELAGSHLFLMDIGIWLLSDKAVRLLRKHSYTEDGEAMKAYDLYAEFGLALGKNPRITDSELNQLSVAILPLPGGEFYHYGTSRELISSTLAVQNLVRDQRAIMQRKVKPHPAMFVQNAVLHQKLTAENSELWIENSYIGENWTLRSQQIITGVPENNWNLSLPEGICVDVVPIGETNWAARPYGFNDLFKGALSDTSTLFMGKPILAWAMERGITLSGDEDIQNAPLFPVCQTVDELGKMLRWMITEPDREEGKHIWLSARKLSANDLSDQANLCRLVAQREVFRKKDWSLLAANHEKSVFYQLDLSDAAESFAKDKIVLPKALSEDNPLMKRIHNHMFRSQVMKILGETYKEEEQKAFALLREGLVGSVLGSKQQPCLNVYRDQIVWGRSPVRIDLAGGWTDTPPYCLYAGGNVVNVAIELNGQPPLQVYIKPSDTRKIILRSIDLGAMEVISSWDELRDYNKVGSPFSIPKAALALAGFIPEFSVEAYASLEAQLEAFGSGLEITLLAAIPAGSGLGTSSILAATVLGAISDFCGLAWDKDEIGNRTLILEQLLTTGGGWQDQYGGVLHGLKLLQTNEGFNQSPLVRWLPEYLFTDPEYRPCHLLYYTGITRTAKDILSEIVRGMFLNSEAHLGLLSEMKAHALDMYEAIQRGDFVTYGKLVGKTWEQNKALDSGTNPAAVEAIISKIQAYALGYKLPGAGGGGYLYIVAKDLGAALQIRKILTLSPPNSNARFVEMSLSNKGLQISRS